MRRFFNQSQRNEIYRRSMGFCEHCNGRLDNSWVADHRIPFAYGGKTSIENGLASCVRCNQKKGARMPDRFEPRRFQQDLNDTVRQRIRSGESVTIAWVGAGSGKTLGYLFAVNSCYRDGLVDGLAAYVPRITLREQAELDCVDFREMLSSPKMGEIIGRDNTEPLVPKDKFGFAACYQSGVSDRRNTTDKRIHLNWAKANQNKFILVLDEAQFVDLSDETGGTQTAQFIEEIAQYALHTIVLTATPIRSDGRPITLATYGKPDENGIRHLDWHVRASYQEGVALGYLRPCRFDLSNGGVEFNTGGRVDLSTLEDRLRAVLRHDAVWKEITERTVKEFREARKSSSNYRCLIAAIDQDHARSIHAYLKREHPDFISVLAISDDDESHKILRSFRPENKHGKNIGDILVTVNMAYIGFDCPPISVIGILSHIRWSGWLEQLIMRAGRMSDRFPKDQHMVIVSTNDKAMNDFSDAFRKESEAGLREREQNDGSDKDSPLPSTSDPIWVKDAELTSQISIGLSVDQDLSSEEFSGLKEFANKLSSPINIGFLAEVLRKSGVDIPRAKVESQDKGKTYTERRRIFGVKAQAALINFIKSTGVYPNDDNGEFQIRIRKLSRLLNVKQEVKSIDDLTESQWGERLRIIDVWTRQGFSS